uniref:Putative secreted protein n=1 Tax=Anopheles triannulatus TaxID=58253 RepID=A0A2M4B2K3_9DIPT
MSKYSISLLVMWATTNRLVTLAVIIPNAMIYRAGWFSYSCSVDFCEMTYAGTTTNRNGMIGDSTLVPATVDPFLPTPPVKITDAF